MQHDRPASGGACIEFLQPPGDVFVRQAVEAIAVHALRPYGRGQGIHLRQFRLGAMERRVETGNLWECGRQRGDGADGRDVVGLMQRRERHQRFEGGDNLVVHADRRCISRTAVDDTVPHREQLDRWVFREALQQERGGAMVAQRFAEFLRDVRAGVRIVDHKP